MRDETRNELYPHLETRVLARRGDRSERDYLTYLGDGLPALREAYRNRNVQVDYRRPEVVDRYLLAYYPHSVDTACQALASVPCAPLIRALQDAVLDVTIIGGGPLPEVVALIDRLLECGITRGKIRVTNIDLNCATWRAAIDDTLAFTARIAPGIDVTVTSRPDNCTLPVPANSPLLPAADLVVVQNCLNEVAGVHLDPHALGWVRSVRAGGHLVVSDLIEYHGTVNAVQRLEHVLTGDGFHAVMRFDPGAADRESAFAWNVPTHTYHGFFGFSRNPQTGQRTFPEDRWPRRWVRSSFASWKRG